MIDGHYPLPTTHCPLCRRSLPLQRSGRVLDDAVLLRRFHGRPVNRDALRRRQAGVLWRRAEIKRRGWRRLGGGVFLTGEKSIKKPQKNPGKEGLHQKKKDPVAIGQTLKAN